MPKLKYKRKMRGVTLLYTEEAIAGIARISAERHIDKAKIYRMFVDIGIQCHDEMEKAGLLDVVDFRYYVKRALEERILLSELKPKPKQLSLL